MNSNINTPDNKSWQWLTTSPTRMVGLTLLVLALVLLLTLMVLVSLKPTKKKVGISIPQPSPTISPAPFPDPTQDWPVLTNTNGFSIKYSPGSQLTPDLPAASTAANLQISAPDQSVTAIEVIDKTQPLLAGQSLAETVDLLRQKNATSSASIFINKVLTKPIAILIGGNEGYEWYLESNGLIGFKSTYQSRLGKNRVIEFDKNNKHYLIFLSFDDREEQLLPVFSLTP